MEIEQFDLKSVLPYPLGVTSLILVFSTPIAIRFRMDEKHFDVDGAYNIRYEIVKKRIDKVRIKETNERLTQPGKIAIVYSQAKDATEYMEYIEFLQNQLEERIKNHSQAEQKIKELTASLQEVSAQSNQSEGKIIFLHQQIESKHHELEHAQLTSDQKDAEIHRVKEELQTKTSQVMHLENLLAEIREQNSILNISFGESQGAITALKEQLAGEQQHIHHMEDKLLKNRQLLERIYRDLESSVAFKEHTDPQQALVKPMY